MSALVSDYTGNTVLIYNIDGDHLVSAVVDEHDKLAKQIHIDPFPDVLKVNDECKLMILASPTPCEFSGKVKKIGGIFYIGMFQGQEREGRAATRYSVNTPALITAFIVDGKLYPIQTPMKVLSLNLSTSGIRFRAPYYSFDIGDEFEMHMLVNNSRKRIVARVVNNMDNSNDTSDYGCVFLAVE